MTDPAQPPAWGTEVPAREPEVSPCARNTARLPRGLQEHHESWTLGEPLPAEPVPMASGQPRGWFAAGGERARPAAPARRGTQAIPDHDDRWALACYLGVIFCWLLVPLAIYLIKRNSSLYIRAHAAQAFNLTLTATLFAVSGGIIGGLLALDSPKVALFTMGPVLFVFWIVVLVHAVRAASSAIRDEFYEIPGWICVPTLR